MKIYTNKTSFPGREMTSTVDKRLHCTKVQASALTGLRTKARMLNLVGLSLGAAASGSLAVVNCEREIGECRY